MDAKYSRWLSTDPAVGEYINGSSAGGGIYNTVNFSLYHYAGNNPVKYTDPDGRAEKLTDKLGKFIKSTTDFIAENKEALIVIGTGLSMIGGGKALKGIGIGGGAAISFGSGGTLAGVGISGAAVAGVIGEALEITGYATLAVGISMLSSSGGGNDENNKEQSAKDAKK